MERQAAAIDAPDDDDDKPAPPAPHWFATYAQYRSACRPRSFEEELAVCDRWNAFRNQKRRAAAAAARPPAPPRTPRRAKPHPDAVVAERMTAAAMTPIPAPPPPPPEPAPRPRPLVRRVAPPAAPRAPRAAKPQPPSEPPKGAAGFIPHYDLAGARTRGEADADLMPVNPQFIRSVEPEPNPGPRFVRRAS